MIFVYACGAFPGQEGEEAVDEDNYWESYHPQNHMVFSPTSIYSAAYLRVTPGRTSCTLADGNLLSQTWLLNVIIGSFEGLRNSNMVDQQL